MREFTVAYVPIGVPTFDMDAAGAAFEASKNLLSELTDGLAAPEGILLGADAVEAFLAPLAPDLVVVQNLTFANAAYIERVLRLTDAPLALWALREPASGGGRLKLNSLTGAFSAANTLRRARKEPVQFVFGAPEDASAREKLRAVIGAARIRRELRESRIGIVGRPPEGFGFGEADEGELSEVFGVRLTHIEAEAIMDAARAIPEGDAETALAALSSRLRGLEAIPRENRIGFARLYLAYRDFAAERDIGFLASRCWPDFFTAYGTPVCAVLSLLNDEGVASACETDAWGALSMYIGASLSGQPVFFGDPAALDAEAGTITFWHCGMAPCTLARDGAADVGVHCNRKIGPTMDFGCRPSAHATLFRVGRAPEGGFRFLAACGEILDAPKQFTGTSLVLRTNVPAESLVRRCVEDGWEPHFAVIYGDVTGELQALGGMLGIPVTSFG